MAACLTVGALTAAVHAQERIFRVIDLGPILINTGPFVAGFPGDGNVTFGVNSKNQIAFAREVEGTMHAHVYLPAPDYGLDAGVYDLHVLGAAPQGDPFFGEDDASIATDISDDGIVVGASGESFNRNSVSVARIWRLDQASASPVSVPTRSLQSAEITDGTSTPDVRSSVAHAVTDGVPGATGVTVRIVGEAWVDRCEADIDPYWGFTVTVPGGSNPAASQMSALRPRSDSRAAYATDVNSPGGLPVGWDAEPITELCPECYVLCDPSETCVMDDPSTNEPLTWPSAGVTASALGLLPDPNVPDLATRAIGLNDASQVVGWGYLYDGDPAACRERAASEITSGTSSRTSFGDTHVESNRTAGARHPVVDGGAGGSDGMAVALRDGGLRGVQAEPGRLGERRGLELHDAGLQSRTAGDRDGPVPRTGGALHGRIRHH